MTFGRTKTLLSFNYYLHGAQLDRTLSIKDLGVYLTPCLDPGLHIAKICSKVNSVLGLIARSSRGSLSTASVKVLYNSLVRPILEYASPVWSPYQVGHCNSLNMVQRRFLRLLGVRDGINYLDVNVHLIAVDHGVLSLTSRRAAFDLLLLFKIINGQVDSPELLELINFYVPVSTRRSRPFSKHHQPTAYAYHSTVPRLLRLGNAAQLEFFGPSLPLFRRVVFKWAADQIQL
ncbi:uncharacterized protein LOC128998953 [Macrosteles quadrilineatus]|uniref:uncharacterized protein LOC128998953 n=1 Tax=Macrosteles quadrilineatus TaxID=74068 RepID=UPI0023E30363|nr:uncharacterized protein LOC128998953 [Macrosteles quadrilineatus]